MVGAPFKKTSPFGPPTTLLRKGARGRPRKGSSPRRGFSKDLCDLGERQQGAFFAATKKGGPRRFRAARGPPAPDCVGAVEAAAGGDSSQMAQDAKRRAAARRGGLRLRRSAHPLQGLERPGAFDRLCDRENLFDPIRENDEAPPRDGSHLRQRNPVARTVRPVSSAAFSGATAGPVVAAGPLFAGPNRRSGRRVRSGESCSDHRRANRCSRRSRH